MTLQWTSALSVGVTEIDAEHQELFRRAGRLLEALGVGRRAEVVEVARDLDVSGQRAVAPFQLGRWLAQWLREHVSGTDKELGRYLAKRSA